MRPYVGWLDYLFGERVTIDLGNGKKKNVTRRWVEEMERQGKMRPVARINVHSLGKTPEFETMDDMDRWLESGGGLYQIESWQIGEQISQEVYNQWRDPQTGDLYIVNQLVDGDWKFRPCTRQVFEQFRREMNE